MDNNLMRELLTPERVRLFWSHTETLTTGCTVWTAADNGKNYGRFYLGKVNGKKVFQYVHIIAQFLREGDIPEGYEVDHTCHDPNVCNLKDQCPHRRCVIHTQAVDRKTNVRRQMRKLCPKGHEYTHIRDGKRFCQTCNTIWARNNRRKKNDVSVHD